MHLKRRLQEYRFSYFKIRVIIGLLTMLLLSVILMGSAAIIEFWLYLSPEIKGWLWIGFAIVFCVELTILVLIPGMKALGWIEGLTDIEIARRLEISDLNLKDSVLNAVLLREQANSKLGKAALDSYEHRLEGVDLRESINRRGLKRWLVYTTVLIVLFFIGYGSSPEMFNQGWQRVTNISQVFVPRPPYEYSLLPGSDVSVVEGDDVVVRITDVTSPNQLDFLATWNGTQRFFDRIDEKTYLLMLKGVQESGVVEVRDGRYELGSIQVNVLERPRIYGLSVDVVPPEYTGLGEQVWSRWDNIRIPEGSDLKVIIEGDKIVRARSSINEIDFSSKDGRRFTWNVRKRKEGLMDTVVIRSRDLKLKEELGVEVIRDEHPEVSLKVVNNERDSLISLVASMRDDYGLSSYTMRFMIRDSLWFEESIKLASKPISFEREITVPKEDVDMRVQVEVFDNDGVNGSKRTEVLEVINRRKSDKDRAIVVNEQLDEFERSLEEFLEREIDLRKRLKDIAKGVEGNKSSEWRRRSELQQELQDQLKRLEQLQRNKNRVKQIKDLKERKKAAELLNDKRLDEKRRELERLMEKLEEAESLKDALNKDDRKESSFEKDLERTLEMFRRMDVKERYRDAMEGLMELSSEQRKLAKRSDEKVMEQEEVNKKAKELENQVKEALEDNSELDFPLDLTDPTEKGLEDNLNNAKENQEKGNTGDANEAQDKAADKMEKMAEEMSASLMSSEAEQQIEDMESLRQTLDNLIYLSFEQEELLNTMKSADKDDPVLNTVTRKTSDVMDETGIVEDSLIALSKRVIQLEGVILEELDALKNEQKNSKDFLINRSINKALSANQKSIMHANNLAVLLDELLSSMQMQMAQMKFGEGACKKPGGMGAPKPGDASGKQKQLGDKMKGMAGKKKGEGKKGKEQGEDGESGGMGGKAKEFAKMAAEQAAIREMVQRMEDELSKNGGGGNLSKLLKEMEEVEKDLLEKNISPETLKRQEEIQSRLLEAEKAMRERGKKEERESRVGRNRQIRSKAFEEYRKQKLKEIELLRRSEGDFTRYYKSRSEKYLAL